MEGFEEEFLWLGRICVLVGRIGVCLGVRLLGIGRSRIESFVEGGLQLFCIIITIPITIPIPNIIIIIHQKITHKIYTNPLHTASLTPQNYTP